VDSDDTRPLRGRLLPGGAAGGTADECRDG
jgi:hypothetical protein